MMDIITRLFYSKSFSLRRLWFFCTTTLLGFIANAMAIELPIVVPFLIGNIAFSIILIRLGFIWSLLALAIVSVPIASNIELFNSILQLFCLMLLTLNLKQPLWRVMGVYTVAIGFIYHQFAYPIFTESPALLVSATLLNGCIFILCTKTALMLNAITITPKNQKNQSLKLQLSHRIGLYSAVPCTILIAFILQGAISLHISSVLQYYDNEQSKFINEIQRHIERYIGNTELIASLGHDNINQNTLRKLTEQQAELISALVTDKNGLISLFYKADLPNSKMQKTSVADRSYFSKPKELSKSYVSETFQGRGLGEDRLFAVSAPLFQNGTFDGVVEISVNLKTLTNTFKSSDDMDSNRILLDRDSKKIWGSDTLGQLGRVWTERPLMTSFTSSVFGQHIFNKVEPIAFTSDGRYIVIRKHLDELNWTALYYLDTRSFVIRYFIYLSIAMISALLLLQYITVLSGRLIHQYTNTLEQITRHTHRWRSDNPNTQPLTFTTTALEFEVLSESINGLQKRVIDSRKAMHKSMAEVSTLNNELEARVKDRTQQLEQERDKAKLLAEIKTRFLANMSHEIRTPITIIKGFTEELLSEATGDTYRTLNRINQNTLHLQNVIDDILDTAKIEQGKMRIALESINLAHFMTDFIDSTAQMAHKKGLSIDYDVSDIADVHIMADPFRLQQILLNLLSNAVKFTATGSITLKAEKTTAQSCSIKVIDQGIGISKQQQSTLFEAFTQANSSTSRDYGGTGLGLYISKQLADAMDISLTVTSEIGQGSTFMLSFNTHSALQKPIKDSTVIATELPTSASHGRKLLIVDDVEDIRILVAAYVKSLNMELLFAENGQQALDIALKHRPDIIIMDQQMPIMDGLSAGQAMRRHGFESVIISLSADVFEQHPVTDTVSPFNATLCKPIDKTQLLNTIQFCLSKHDITLPNEDITSMSAQQEMDGFDELRQDYLESLRAIPDELNLLAATSEHKQVVMLFHKIKGTSACLGLHDVSATAQQAEAALRDGGNLNQVCNEFNARLTQLFSC